MSERASTKGRDDELASASCPQELDRVRLQVAAEAAYLAFQRNVRRTHDYLPEPAPFSEKEGYLRDCYVEMCRAAFDAYAAAGWQPIATAPKDGTRIDIFIDGGRATDVWWGRPDHTCGEAGRYCDSCPTRDGWCDIFGYINGEDGWAADEPTHWQPLPPPPASSGRNRADATPKNPLSEGRERS